MPDFGNLVKNGWHPEKAGTTFKGQMSSLRGKKSEDDTRKGEHVARPISSLRDPKSFAPPPRRSPNDPIPPPPSRTATGSTSTAAPTESHSYNDTPHQAPQYQQHQAQQHQPTQAAAEEQEPPNNKPWRVNSTGLRTDHLPPPPGRRDGADGRSPAQAPPLPAPAPRGAAAPPSLPPRLPARAGSGSSSPAPVPVSSPPPQTGGITTGSGGGYLNQGALNRLGSSGVSVPSLGIGQSSYSNHTSSPSSSPSAPGPSAPVQSNTSGSHMNELQNRFSKMGKSSFGTTSSTPSFGGSQQQQAPAEGTTMEQKQAALRTASNFHKDPSSVSMSDARGAASTFNNFRQRHGEQVAQGVRGANSLNQKYGVSDKVGGFARGASGVIGQNQAGGQAQVGAQQEGVVGGDVESQSPGASYAGESGASSAAMGVAGKKKPPPPPKKKPGLAGGPLQGQVDDDTPPPIPMATRPQ